MKHIIKNIVAFFLLLFGLVTLFMSSSVIFDWFGIRAKEGNFVPFIVWANWVCSFAYLLAAFGLFRLKPFAAKMLLIAAIVLIVAFLGLVFYINAGGIYETKTLYAMIFRTTITAILAVYAYSFFRKNKP